MEKVAVVTGGSSGIGRAAAEYLAAHGCRVYEFSRRGGDNGAVRHVYADVTDEASVAAAVEQVAAREGRIDILINNAGFGISGAVEFTPAREAMGQLDVNFWGMVRVTRCVLPHMRAAGGGRIVNTSSVAALTPIPFQAYYSVSKAAVNSFTMALANEVRPFGITVCAVMPGDTRTGFTDARVRRFDGDDVYDGRIARSVGKMETDERRGGSPEIVGAALGRAALARDGKVLRTVGFAYKAAAAAMRLLPSALANRILGKLYAD